MLHIVPLNWQYVTHCMFSSFPLFFPKANLFCMKNKKHSKHSNTQGTHNNMIYNTHYPHHIFKSVQVTTVLEFNKVMVLGMKDFFLPPIASSPWKTKSAA